MYILFKEGTDREKIKTIVPKKSTILDDDIEKSYFVTFTVSKIQGLLLERQLRNDLDVVSHGLGFTP